MKKYIMKEIIENIGEIDEDLFVVIPKNSLSPGITCLLVTQDELEKMPNVDKQNFVIGMYVLSDVYDNLYKQKDSINDEEIVKALNFYIDNDAFIECNKL